MMSSSHIPLYASHMSDKPKSQPQEKFIIRFPDGMRDRIAKAAEESGRSMNAEIVHRLEKSMELSQVVGAATGLADGALESVDMAKIWTRMLQKGIDQDEAAAQTAEAMKEMREQILLLRQTIDALAQPDSTNKKPRK